MIELERSLVELDKQIEVLQDAREELHRIMADKAGMCKCKNWHYPHCGEEMEIDKETADSLPTG